MYPIDVGVDAAIDDDVDVLIVSPPRNTGEEEAPNVDPVPVRHNESAPLSEAENLQTEAERQPPVTEIPSGDSERQVSNAIHHVLLIPITSNYVDSFPNHIDDD